MQLNAPNRREVIEDLLDIKVFSRMNLLLKDRLRDIRNEVKECEHTVTLHQKTYDMQTATVQRMEGMVKDVNDDLASQLMSLKEENFAVETNIASTETEIRDLTDKLANSASSQAQYSKMREYIASVKTKVNRNLSDLDFFIKNDSKGLANIFSSVVTKLSSSGRVKAKSYRRPSVLIKIWLRIN